MAWIRFAEGDGLLEDDNAPDSMNAFRPGSKGLICLTFDEGRAVWRDLAALLPDQTGTEAQPAESVNWACNLYEASGHWDAQVSVLVAGLASVPGQMKFLRARAECHQLPAVALREPDAASEVRAQLKRCNDLFYDISGVARNMVAKALPDSDRPETKKRARAILETSPFTTTYFSTAERELPAFMSVIGTGAFDAAHRHWSAVLLDAARTAWDSARQVMGTSAAALRAQAIARGRFEYLLKDLKAGSPTDTRTVEPTT